MKIGMLWFIENYKTHPPVEDEIKRAADYYNTHYQDSLGKANLCQVNPNEFSSLADSIIDGVIVIPNNSILPHHLWIGNDNA
jgi:hypothetical protein